MPVATQSAHWLAHPAFADAVERFLEREGEGIEQYMSELDERSPLQRRAAAESAGAASTGAPADAARTDDAAET